MVIIHTSINFVLNHSCDTWTIMNTKVILNLSFKIQKFPETIHYSPNGNYDGQNLQPHLSYTNGVYQYLSIVLSWS